MRAILTDWMIDVAVEFWFYDDTLHLGVRLMDAMLVSAVGPKARPLCAARPGAPLRHEAGRGRRSAAGSSPSLPLLRPRLVAGSSKCWARAACWWQPSCWTPRAPTCTGAAGATRAAPPHGSLVGACWKRPKRHREPRAWPYFAGWTGMHGLPTAPAPQTTSARWNGTLPNSLHALAGHHNPTRACEAGILFALICVSLPSVPAWFSPRSGSTSGCRR